MRALSLFLLLLPIPNACLAQSDGAASPAAVKEISPTALAAMLKNTPVFLADVNEDFTYAEAHVPGATLLVYDAITADKLPVDQTAAVVFYCYSAECPAAETAAHTAAGLGFVNVYCMKEGITGWQDAGLPTEP